MRSLLNQTCDILRPLNFWVACCGILMACDCRVALAQQADRDETLLFVGDVLTKTEYLAVADNRVVKWAQSPTLSVFGDRDRHRSIVAATLREINKSLPEDIQIKFLEDEDESASMKIYFIKQESFTEIADRHDFNVVAGNRGFFCVKWNGKCEIEEAIILIAEDKLAGPALRHYVLEETVQAMGLGGDSKRFANSIFYEDIPKQRFGTATRLAARDRKLIRFLYAHVAPGSVPIEVGQLFERHW